MSAREQWMTLGFIVAMIHLVIAYDLAVYWLIGDSATISRVALAVQLRYPLLSLIVTFSLGLLIGHLFLYQAVRK